MPSLLGRLRAKVGPIRTLPIRTVRSLWSRIGFFHFHLMTFFVTSLIAGIIIYLIELSYTKSSFLDAWFMAVSSLCVTGLSSIDVAKMGTASLVIMWFCMILGGSVLASLAPVLIRWTYFRRHVAQSQRHSTMKFPVARALVGLSRQEYRALTKLIILIPTYAFFFTFMGGIILFAYAWGESYTADLLRSREINPWWFASFHAVAAFNNSGFSLMNDNLTPFLRSPGLLFIFCILIVAGNVGFPIILRLFVTLFHKVASIKHKKVFRFLLDHPRLCFVYLFPAQQTLYLFGVLVLFTCLQWFLEMGLDWSGAYFNGVSPVGRVVVSFFQAISTRTAGFNAFDLSLSSPSVQVVYLVMMYISSYPVAVSARTSTVHKGARRPEDEEEAVYHTRENNGGKNNVKYQAKNLIFRDVSYLFVGLMIISIVEDERITHDPGFSLFKILFELVSAYGTVGLSLGYPGSVLSLSGSFQTISKLVIIVVMLLGRHRGLPLSIDHAINYTSAIAIDIEAESAKLRPLPPMNRSKSSKSQRRKKPLQTHSERSETSESSSSPRGDGGRRDHLAAEMMSQVMFSPGGTRRVTVDLADVDRRKSRMRSDSF